MHATYDLVGLGRAVYASGVQAFGLPIFVWTAVAALLAMQETPQRPTFRTSTELVSIDVNVVDRDGGPVDGLGAEQFEVFVDGKRRPVSQLEFVRTNRTATSSSGPAAENPYSGGRVVVLAVDEGSFPMSAQAAAREAATRVLNSLSPEDFIGLVTFPGRTAI